jgi:hypothetical protein
MFDLLETAIRPRYAESTASRDQEVVLPTIVPAS